VATRIPLKLQESGNGLYVAEGKVYPRSVRGRFTRLREWAAFVLLGFFYLGPWLRWDGRQAILLDLPARRFHVFGLDFWPQDFVFLAVLLILAGLALFFFTALAGRLWCGYACPQTVWTEVFVRIERVFEGDRAQQMRLAASPWTREKSVRRFGKHAVWLLLSLWTGFTFVGFFTPVTDLAARLPQLAWGPWETFWVLFYGFATWGNAGVLREQVCKYMCPYARFQSAMFDRDTLLISYDPMRGEPRGARRRGLASVLQRARGLLAPSAALAAVVAAARAGWRGESKLAARATTALAVDEIDLGEAPRVDSPEDLGDCIDCTICVQVCPTGIDIRNGLQYECIACGACIDACDGVMDRLGYPRGLIRYTTQNAVDGRPTRMLRARVLIYGLLLLGIFAAWLWSIGQRDSMHVDVLRDRNALYRVLQGGVVENSYTLKLGNRARTSRRFELRLLEPGFQLLDAPLRVEVGAAAVAAPALTVRVEGASARGMHELSLQVESLDPPRELQLIPLRFIGPAE
jgi:polyferredoxin